MTGITDADRRKMDHHNTRALVHGILGLVFPIFVFPILALKHAKRVPMDFPNRGMAVAGKVMGIIGLVYSSFLGLYIILMVVFFGAIISSY